ncbi:4-amino-4-deoxy-L-arabinose lipid A transferase [Yersinia pseudotuberculosis]|uniref:Undecaprenyl phosphate-alpha-4-amino-4-deoxy-L-arabinose arabinosyl transferase n=1 Tax=Yersinia pseudotuberculosis serotype O:3 (strain YPIII) TaxID=502800 RepID=ARNT_YERPY|nr:lipid IV(A) 4-amino-4-deoxy-L-arabinosyltransferase [Yersinia pseudotuberculosis]B1JJ32.1 RecName: Full=Undecaprenyl phosphate-alpha-4-amino-4-deoxy-L-arabinose arabinosyl transferase; AltName: Full=4-amino-4-deoxy-L-arabinose lipid A transferase; AltName: Full=Lipid IV(A) 4-amino-4-deoxy-L-arabinosyltransferase; AltName: Full=Undecaprenyl phosphate-alpha-L-Ara4N transferase [Yersinia pseudotuberculosis YPIII]AJJ59699.1 dolichyl-phosphate-mannose-mannosyltransferase family protein [Yersinia ps
MKLLKDSGAALLALFFVLVYLLPVNSRLLWQPDETRYAEISREMLQRGDWVVPYFMDIRYFEKPVAGYWFNNISQWIFGDSNFAVRFGSIFSTALSAVLVYWLATLLWRNRSTSVLATLIYLSFLLVFGIGTYAVLDPMISLWLTAAMVSFYLTLKAENWQQKVGAYALLGVACGMGFMTKGFLALAVPVIAVLPIVIQQKRIKDLVVFGPIAIVCAVLLSLPWALAIAQREPDFWNYFFWVEHIQRFAEASAQHKSPIWYYLPILCIGVLPWLGLLPGALFKGWRERATKPELFFLLSWVVMPLLFFSVAKGKLPTYILPCMAPLSLLMAAYATDCANNIRMRALKINGVINLLFGVACALVIVVIGLGLVKDIVAYGPQENQKVWLGVLAFAGWGVTGFITLRNNARNWRWAAACPLLFILLVGYLIPQQVVDSKQPQNFIKNNFSELSSSRYVLTDSVGVAAGLAWELKRSDILMFSEKGELTYGLAYPDSQDNYISNDDFPTWLAQARKKGDVSLVVQLARNEALPAHLPSADKVNLMNRLALLWYQKTP